MSDLFVIEEGEDWFVTDQGWTALIARYVRFPDERRERHGYPVLVPTDGNDMAFLRRVCDPLSAFGDPNWCNRLTGPADSSLTGARGR